MTYTQLLFAACKAVVDEIQYKIKNTDPKKTIDIGGREKRAVRYAGSETHLIELTENIWYDFCSVQYYKRNQVAWNHL